MSEARDTVDVVGHFGSRFSYATHAVELARALKAAGLLGRCWNLDDGSLEDYEFLWPELAGDLLDGGASPADAAEDERPSRAAFLITAPRESVRSFARAYETSALFVCPNTDTLSQEAVETVMAFPRLIVPSRYCNLTLTYACARHVGPNVGFVGSSVLPLGVHDVFLEGRRFVREEAERRVNLNMPPQVVHFTSDWFWPGRKGTEELIAAWPAIAAQTGAQLTIHCVAPMVDSIYYYCADRGLLPDAVTVVGAHSPRGALPHQIFDAMAQADLVVQPSRAEGYGMIALAAIVAGVPLASTASTGECDFLYASRAWCKIDTSESGPLEGEEGLAPTVTPFEIERAVTSALARLGALRASAASSETQTCVRCYTWRRCMHSWVDYAREMLAHTARGLRLPPL